jgi:hypothetical protein
MGSCAATSFENKTVGSCHLFVDKKEVVLLFQQYDTGQYDTGQSNQQGGTMNKPMYSWLVSLGERTDRSESQALNLYPAEKHRSSTYFTESIPELPDN